MDRLNRLGWTVDRAVTEPPEYYKLFGRRYKTVRELSEHPCSKHDEAMVFKLLKEGTTTRYAIGAVSDLNLGDPAQACKEQVCTAAADSHS